MDMASAALTTIASDLPNVVPGLTVLRTDSSQHPTDGVMIASCTTTGMLYAMELIELTSKPGVIHARATRIAGLGVRTPYRISESGSPRLEFGFASPERLAYSQFTQSLYVVEPAHGMILTVPITPEMLRDMTPNRLI